MLLDLYKQTPSIPTFVIMGGSGYADDHNYHPFLIIVL